MYCKLSLRDVRAVMRSPGLCISLPSHTSPPAHHLVSLLSSHYHSLSLSQKNKFLYHGSIFLSLQITIPSLGNIISNINYLYYVGTRHSLTRFPHSNSEKDKKVLKDR